MPLFRKSFVASAGGRMACATAAVGAAGAGAVALAGAHAYAALVAVTFACVLGSIATVVLALEDYWREALALMLALPWIGGPYLALLHALAGAGLAAGAPLIALGFVFAALPIRHRAAGAATRVPA